MNGLSVAKLISRCFLAILWQQVELLDFPKVQPVEVQVEVPIAYKMLLIKRNKCTFI